MIKYKCESCGWEGEQTNMGLCPECHRNSLVKKEGLDVRINHPTVDVSEANEIKMALNNLTSNQIDQIFDLFDDRNMLNEKGRDMRKRFWRKYIEEDSDGR